MDIETRITNLENLVHSLVVSMNNQKFYTDSDVAGCRHTEGTLDNKIDATNDNINITTETVDGIMTDVIPELAEADANLTATIDSILTDIIPSIIGE